MNNIEMFAQQSEGTCQFISAYFGYISKLLSDLDTKTVAAFIDALELARREQKTVFLVGNGGSAATASHMATDLNGSASRGNDDFPLRALALTDNVTAITAIANDDGCHNIFVRQLTVHYRSGDILVAISASGNSANVITAAEWVKQRGGKVIGLVGFDGGKLKDLCDLVIHVKTPSGEYGPVEDIHMILDHLVYSWMGNRVTKKPGERGDS